MFKEFPQAHQVPFDGTFDLSTSPTEPLEKQKRKYWKKQLQQSSEGLYELQREFYAHDKHAILLIFQAMDAAGKDSTIRHVMRHVNPAGCQVASFKQPSSEELDHDFLWRTTKKLPERGRIGIFNRSYYEEVLILKVHPEYVAAEKLPEEIDLSTLWNSRYESIRSHEKHLAANGFVILKFWLNISKAEQKNRFLSRLDTPEKNWKFSASDIKERQYWDDYMLAYEAALNETSCPWAPWYAIPADDKPYARAQVAEIIVNTMKQLKTSYPTVSEKQRSSFAQARKLLELE